MKRRKRKVETGKIGDGFNWGLTAVNYGGVNYGGSAYGWPFPSYGFSWGPPLPFSGYPPYSYGSLYGFGGGCCGY